MTNKQAIMQLKSLLDDAKDSRKRDKDNEIFKKDIQALNMAIAAIKENEELNNGLQYINKLLDRM